MATIDFDGANLRVLITGAGDLDVTAQELYSRWKDWVKDENAGPPPAFRTIGGDPLGGGVEAGDYYFLQNDLGWRIAPKEASHILTINGNLFAEDSGFELFALTAGSFNVQIRLRNSSLTQTAGGSDPADIAQSVWEFPVPVTPDSGSFGEVLARRVLTVAKFLGLK